MAPYTNSENYSVMKSDGAFVPYHTRHIKAHPLVMPVISFQIRGKVANSRELLSHIRKKTHCAQGHKKKKKKKEGNRKTNGKPLVVTVPFSIPFAGKRYWSHILCCSPDRSQQGGVKMPQDECG